MRNQWKGFVSGFLLALLVLGFAIQVFAAHQKPATLQYKDIKITLDGEKLIPKDENGKVVEPFILDGTTYLPVRAISDALSLGVVWDESTNTVELTRVLTYPDQFYKEFSVPSFDIFTGASICEEPEKLRSLNAYGYSYHMKEFSAAQRSNAIAQYEDLLTDYGYRRVTNPKGTILYLNTLTGTVVQTMTSGIRDSVVVERISDSELEELKQINSIY